MIQHSVVIYNPKAGRGRAKKLIESTRQWAAPDCEIQETAYPGHAGELAEQAAKNGYHHIIAAGGDGTVHEVGEGLVRSGVADVCLGIWPIGSSNDYANHLGIKDWFATRGQGHALEPISIDVGRVWSGQRSSYFLNCLGIGFNGIVALESRRIPWLRGMPLYSLAFLQAMWKHFRTPVLQVHFDHQLVELPTLALSVNLGQREGGFPITPLADLQDGWFDYLQVADVWRWELIRYLPALMTGKLPSDHPKLRQGRCQQVRVESQQPLCVHVEGEFFCQPQDNVLSLDIELLPSRLKVNAAPLKRSGEM